MEPGETFQEPPRFVPPAPSDDPAPMRGLERRHFAPRDSILAMIAAGKPDALFVALCRHHPDGPPPDVKPSFADAAFRAFQPEPLFHQRGDL